MIHAMYMDGTVPIPTEFNNMEEATEHSILMGQLRKAATNITNTWPDPDNLPAKTKTAIADFVQRVGNVEQQWPDKVPPSFLRARDEFQALL